MTKRMVIDVESVGLHGEAFAVGWVVLDHLGNEVASGLLSCPSRMAAAGTQPDRAWVQENVVPVLPVEATHTGVYALHEAFWEAFKAIKPDELWADCPWPVEARFLNKCIDHNRDARNWEGPYPLLDVGVMVRASGRDAMANHPRLADELPAHNPLADARQSARLLLEAEARLSAHASVSSRGEEVADG